MESMKRLTSPWLLAAALAALATFPATSAQAAVACAKFNSLPAAEEGRLGYDIISHNFYVCNGTSWVFAFGS